LSSDYRLFETRQFQKDLERLARAGEPTVVAKLEQVVYPQLRRHPHFGPNIRKLRAFEPDTWRYRIGAWRFFYEIDEDDRVVLLTAAAHRGSAY
jgi:mRNA interferase RelE/StbE